MPSIFIAPQSQVRMIRLRPVWIVVHTSVQIPGLSAVLLGFHNSLDIHSQNNLHPLNAVYFHFHVALLALLLLTQYWEYLNEFSSPFCHFSIGRVAMILKRNWYLLSAFPDSMLLPLLLLLLSFYCSPWVCPVSKGCFIWLREWCCWMCNNTCVVKLRLNVP